MIEKLAIVVVTYRRQTLLQRLFDSFLQMDAAPWRIVVTDNENSEETAHLVGLYQARIDAGDTACPWQHDDDTFVYLPQAENTGGSGGFYAGMKAAYEMGAEWFWLMDDDVTVLADALPKLEPWTSDYTVVQGSRLDTDGGAFYWQYRFLEHMAIYDPFASAKFDASGAKPTNTACFEGGLFKRDIVDEIGFPDYRFFIYWDDCIYGYLASKYGSSILIRDVILQRTREIKNWEVGTVRQLNAASDLSRFYIMRNRGYMACYLKLHRDFRPFGFAIGTILSFAKEFIRLITVDRGSFASGAKRLFSGWRASRRLMHDADWQPMPRPDLGFDSDPRPDPGLEPVSDPD